MTEDNSNESRPDEVLIPRNFFASTGAGLKLYRPVAGRIALEFCALIGLFFTVLVGVAYLTSSIIDSTALGASFAYAQVLGPPLLGSLLLARASRVMVGARVGRSVSIRRAGRSMRQSRSHILAAAMLSMFLTFAIAFAMGPLGFSLGTHLLLGPPLLTQVIALERLSFAEGWARTKELARGEALRTFLYLLCLALALVLVELVIIGSVYTLLQSALSMETPQLLLYPILGVVTGGGMSLMSAFILESYLELRVRDDEDFDLEELAAELEEEEELEEEAETGE